MANHFAGRLRELRRDAGLTQQQLAEKAGLGLRMITYLESGQQGPSWETVLALSAALGVECTAFNQAPAADLPPPKEGRPKKPADDGTAGTDAKPRSKKKAK